MYYISLRLEENWRGGIDVIHNVFISREKMNSSIMDDFNKHLQEIQDSNDKELVDYTAGGYITYKERSKEHTIRWRWFTHPIIV